MVEKNNTNKERRDLGKSDQARKLIEIEVAASTHIIVSTDPSEGSCFSPLYKHHLAPQSLSNPSPSPVPVPSHLGILFSSQFF